MVREVAIAIYLFLFRIVFYICKLYPQKRKTVAVASFGDNIYYTINAIRNLSDEPIIILKDSSCRFKFKRAATEIIPFNWKQPLQYIKSIYHLATATTVLVDTYYGFLATTNFRPGTTCIQLWHAAGAIKKFGLQDPTIVNRSKRAKKRFRKVYDRFHYTVVGSEKMATVFKKSFGLTDDRILRTGVPRTDFFYDHEIKLRNYQRMKQKFPSIHGKKVLLYAPTFRNDQLDYFHIDLDIEMLREQLSEEYILFIKLHPVVAQSVHIHPNDDFVFDVSKEKIQALMTITDILITDYSSIPFEFAFFERPIIFYAYDLDSYKQASGLIEDYQEEMPGPIVSTTTEIIQVIEENQFDLEKIRRFKRKWNEYSNGNASLNLAKTVLHREEIEQKEILI